MAEMDLPFDSVALELYEFDEPGASVNLTDVL